MNVYLGLGLRIVFPPKGKSNSVLPGKGSYEEYDIHAARADRFKGGEDVFGSVSTMTKMAAINFYPLKTVLQYSV